VIPVVLIHRGFQDYLQYSILEACRKNQVILLGDVDPKIDDKNFTFTNPNGLMQDVDKFSQLYIHMNTTPISYELFCFTRWFNLRNWMVNNGVEVAFYIDSDVLFFEEANTEWKKFSQYDMTLLHRTAGISSFVTLKGIHNFCDMLMKIYSNKNSYDYNKIASHFDVRRKFGLPGGVCDMTLLEYFHYHADYGGGPGRVGEMMAIIDNETYDHNINVPDNDFEFQAGLKRTKLDELGNIYVHNNKLKRDVKFNSLHFQGSAKGLMKGFYERFMEK